MDEDVAKQLAARDRLRRELARRATPQERLHTMARLQRLAWESLRRSPQGYAHFLRRNFKARAVPVKDQHAD